MANNINIVMNQRSREGLDEGAKNAYLFDHIKSLNFLFYGFYGLRYGSILAA